MATAPAPTRPPAALRDGDNDGGAGAVTRRLATRLAAGGLAMVVTSVLVIQLGGHRRSAPTWPPAQPPLGRDMAPARARNPGGHGDPTTRAIVDDTPLPLAFVAPDAQASSAPPPASTWLRVVQGPIEDVLYGSTAAAHSDTTAADQALRLFAHELDLTRDVALGDRVRLVVRNGALDYAELDRAQGAIRLYRIRDTGDDADAFVDETGAGLKSLLLRTPVGHPRLTSPFGLRLHPLLGYTRMHQGVDFGVPVGSPVMAAGDGTVEAARWALGYGRWIRLRHADGYETAYAHLSAFAPGVAPGRMVRQSEVIGWSGNSGLSTGPHLHFEVWLNGRAIDPATAAPASPPSSSHLAAVMERRRLLERALGETLPAGAP